jgi:hypothetical protein
MAGSTTRVNLISLVGLLFLGAVLALTPEVRQLMSRLAFWVEGVEERMAEARRARETETPSTDGEGRSQEGQESEERPAEPPPLPPHVLRGEDGNYYPEPGYSWVNDEPDDTSVRWVPGVEHKEHPHVLSSQEPDQWHPAPGYAWAEAKGVNDMRVVWIPGKRHPDYEHVLTADKEGEWKPEPGYRWVNDDPHDLSVQPEEAPDGSEGP